MGLLSHVEALTKGAKRSSGAGASPDDVPNGNESDTQALDKDEGNLLMSLVAQLRPGMDLTKIALPTFVLEPRSLLERITDFFSHPELIFGAGDKQDARERFMHVLTFYLSGWHIKPRGVKKPYNPVLNEFYRCVYYYPDGSNGYYVAEQVSHHPPVSAFCYISPQNGIYITGELMPKSKFLGNSAATIMEGEDRIRFLNRPEDGEYCISMPNTYARGILFGKMILELGDLSTIQNEKTGYRCDVDFKTKGWVSGGYNIVQGNVKGPEGRTIGDLAGMWSGAIDYTDKASGKKQTVFESSSACGTAKSVLPEAEQDWNESRRLWRKLTDAIKVSDMNAAQAAKSEVEEHQRELRAEREAKGEPAPQSRFFRPVGEKWFPKLGIDDLPKDVRELDAAVRKWIFDDRVPGPPPPNTRTGAVPLQSVEVPPVQGQPQQQVQQGQPQQVLAQQQPQQMQTQPPQPTTTAPAPIPSQQQAAAGGVPVHATSPPPPPASATAPGPPAPGPHYDQPPK